jgi:uncharacterized membrane protein YeaQ/YmgE (transglycosylase-associated protein family)
LEIINFSISLISGAVGGNIAGSAMKDKSLGILGNSIAGIFGGGIGNFITQALGILGSNAGTEQTLTSILSNVGVSGVGGAVLLIIVALIKNAVKK